MRDWDACYLKGETPWDKGGPAPPLQELIECHGRELWGTGTVLVPGCGLGHDVRALAELGLAVLGLDLSPFAVERAGGLPRVGAEDYAQGDFLDPAWRAGRRFSAIWEHTCFCAIDPARRADYAAAAAAVLDRGGVLAGVFYLTPNDPGEESDEPPFNVSIEQLDAIFAPHFQKFDGWVPRRVFPGREGREWTGVFRRI